MSAPRPHHTRKGRLEKALLAGGILLLLQLASLALPGWAPTPLPAGTARAETTPLPEYQVKAAFLFNFLKFVEWPAGAGAGAPFTIGILGRDPFGQTLEAVQGRSPAWRRVVIRRFHRVEEVRDCQILFISASEHSRLGGILKQLQRSPVLTLSDQERFCEAGGMINLVSVKGKVGLEINVAAARNVGLKISSNLLKLARITREDE